MCGEYQEDNVPNSSDLNMYQSNYSIENPDRIKLREYAQLRYQVQKDGTTVLVQDAKKVPSSRLLILRRKILFFSLSSLLNTFIEFSPSIPLLLMSSE